MYEGAEEAKRKARVEPEGEERYRSFTVGEQMINDTQLACYYAGEQTCAVATQTAVSTTRHASRGATRQGGGT